METLHWKPGSVQSKAISLFILAAITVAPTQLAFASFGDGSPTIPNLNVFGGLSDAPQIDGASGAFTQQLSLDIPPGRNGLQPDLSLQYNSQSTSDGIAGYGWSLSIPYVQRLNKTGSQYLYGTNAFFTSSIDGELVASTTPVTSTLSTTTPSIETGTYGSTGYAQCTSASSVTFSKTVSATSTVRIRRRPPD
ncbi:MULTISPECIES: SpvB/TcaC N-terminal domain-containing protein [unclassified Bradyrhizobium]|uniref:SpvB/TcaC N-terminal domain-containing protein n=1 Tax=Bradyrhizobium sp. USDA 4541 TaxID=2817704 RepID=UPI0020A45F00|nr:SpvB/TcaC N-terminal domain-containing protein [Bradyrhizobium sp. USDA 4541]MCP1846748.1 hypothetical protein [Bradyrhizobium sp. USDA 4541]